jgi:hypothetical protein
MQIGPDDFPALAFVDRTIPFDNFQNHPVIATMQITRPRALPGKKVKFATSIGVIDWHGESVLNLLTHEWSEHFSAGTHKAQPEQSQLVATNGLRDSGQHAGIARYDSGPELVQSPNNLLG